MSSESDDDPIFKALAHRRRRDILDLLKEEPRTTGALCEAFPEMDRCTVMNIIAIADALRFSGTRSAAMVEPTEKKTPCAKAETTRAISSTS